MVRPGHDLTLLHGADCPATTVVQTCAHWAGPRRCRFCGIELSLAGGRTPRTQGPRRELVALAAWAAAHDDVTHVVLTTGCGHPQGAEIGHLAACAVKDASNLPVHAQ